MSWDCFRLRDMQSVRLFRSVLLCPVVRLFLSVLICPVVCLFLSALICPVCCPLVLVSTNLPCLLSPCSGQHSSVLFVVPLFRSVIVGPICCPRVPVSTLMSHCPLAPVRSHLPHYCLLVLVSTLLSYLFPTHSAQHSSVLFAVRLFLSVHHCPVCGPPVPVSTPLSCSLSACSCHFSSVV